MAGPFPAIHVFKQSRKCPTSSPSTSPPRSPTRTARRISGMPMRRSAPTPSRASCGSTATTSISSPAPTSTARRCCRPAAKEGLTPAQLRDRNVPRFEAMVERLNCSNDDFIHTTEERHHRSSEEIWRRMEANGDIYLDKYAGWYSVRDEAYYAEVETHLNEQKVRVSSKTGTPVEWVEEESYFFRLSAYQQKLLGPVRPPELRAAEGAAQRSGELRARWPAGSVDLAHHLRLGHPRARQRQAHHVCVGRRAHQLHHRRRLSRHRERQSSSATGRRRCT